MTAADHSPALHLPSQPEPEARIQVKATLNLTTGPLDYEASAGSVRVRRDDETPLADVFYLAYRAVSTPGHGPRPVTFLFNGGPGSASLWLNVGGFGPKRAATPAPLPAPPAPYDFAPNPHTLLAHSDLVFLDAVGTGFSRLAPGASSDEAWGVDQDVDVFARAITRYLTVTSSWGAPRYLFGESYGTTRAAALVHRLQNQGLDFNGVILLSTLLNFANQLPGADQAYINMLPTLAATAHYHGRGVDGSIHNILREVRDFAQGAYASALQAGDRVDLAGECELAQRLARYLGLAPEYVVNARLRVDMESYRRTLLADRGELIGRFDTRFTTGADFAGGTARSDPATDDPATAGVNSIHLAALQRHLAEDFDYRSDLHYRPLHNMVIESAWDWHHRAPGFDEIQPTPNVSYDLAAAMRRNVNLGVCVLGGIYDLATPFAGAAYDLDHLCLSERLRANLRCHWYESGHMAFVDEHVLPQMTTDLAAFYEQTLPPDRG